MIIWTSPTGHIAGVWWENPTNGYDENTDSNTYEFAGGNAWSTFIEFTLETPIPTDRIRFNTEYVSSKVNQIDLDAYYDTGGGADWHHVYQGTNAPNRTWIEKLIPDGLVQCAKFRLRLFNDYSSPTTCRVYEVDFGFEPTVPTIETLDASNIKPDQANLGTKVTDDMGKSISVRHNYGKTTEYGMNTPWQEGKHTNDIITQTVSDLDPETLYHFRGEAFFED